MIASFTFFTPSKITLYWEIKKKRLDGFHDVAGILLPIAWWDQITICPAQENVLKVSSKTSLGPADQNLIMRSIDIFQQYSGLKLSLGVQLKKCIPVGAGLGGGSANAAGMLMVLNEHHGNPLSWAMLQQAAAELGSDAPFFLKCQPATVKERGEQYEVLFNFPHPLWLVIATPDFSIATSEAYQWMDTLATHQPAPAFTLPCHKAEAVKLFYNHFETALFPRFPALKNIRETLYQQGALAAGISGSGSSVVGIFHDAGSAQKAALALRHAKQQVQVTYTLKDHHYPITLINQ